MESTFADPMLKTKGRFFSCCSIPFAAMKTADWIEQCRGRRLQKRDVQQKQQEARPKLVPSVAEKQTVGCPHRAPIKSPDPAPRAPATRVVEMTKKPSLHCHGSSVGAGRPSGVSKTCLLLHVLPSSLSSFSAAIHNSLSSSCFLLLLLLLLLLLAFRSNRLGFLLIVRQCLCLSCKLCMYFFITNGRDHPQQPSYNHV